MKKKIIISANSSWNIYNFRIPLINELTKKYDVIILSPSDIYTDRILSFKTKYYNIKISRRGLNFLKEIKLIYNYYKLLKLIKPDLYIGFTIKPNIYGNFVCRILNIKSVNTFTGLGSVFLTKSLINYFIKLFLKISLFFANKIIFQNIHDLNYFVKKKIVTLNKTVVIPGSGVNISKFKYSTNTFTKKFKFLFAGRLIHEKGIFELIEAIKILKKENLNLEFTIIGSLEISSTNFLKQAHLDSWKKLNIVNFIEHKNDILNDLVNTNCVVFPSYREGLSMFLLEAISVGRPIITSNVPGCNDIVYDGYNGLLFEPRNTKDLIMKIKKIYKLG